MEIFNDKDRARTLDLLLYNTVNEIRADAKDLADNIPGNIYVDLYKDNFISSF